MTGAPGNRLGQYAQLQRFLRRKQQLLQLSATAKRALSFQKCDFQADVNMLALSTDQCSDRRRNLLLDHNQLGSIHLTVNAQPETDAMQELQRGFGRTA